MRTWLRRLAGGITSLLSLWKAVDLLWGLPGRLDDTEVWQEWIEKVSATDAIYPIGIVGGLALATSEWWWPRIALAIRSRRHSSVDSVGEIDDDLARFRACQPHIERCRKLIQPLAGPLGSANMGLQILSDGGSKVAELIHDLGYLTRQLETLEIRHPMISDPDGTGALRVGIWNMYLAKLEVMIRHDDIAGARRLEPVKQSTSDK